MGHENIGQPRTSAPLTADEHNDEVKD